MSGASGYGQFDERDEELEWLRKLVRDLELEAKGKRQREDQDNQEGGSTSQGDRYGIRSNQSGSRRHRDRHVLGNPVDTGTACVHGSMQTGIQTPPKSDDLVMLPWML